MPTNLPALTGIRFLAAAWVVLHHLQNHGDIAPSTLGEAGGNGVQFFFILSGFILSHVYFRDYTPTKFIWLRIARILPVHIVCTLAMLVLVAPTNDALQLLPSELSLARYWFSEDRSFWNAPAWSISIEFFAYLFLFPVCFVAFRETRSRILLAVAVLTLIAAQRWAGFSALPGLSGTIVGLFLAGSALYRLRDLCPYLRGDWVVMVSMPLMAIGIVAHKSPVTWLSFAVLICGLSYGRGSSLPHYRPVFSYTAARSPSAST